MTRPCPWVARINQAKDAFTLRVLFMEATDLLSDNDIHNSFFERIYFLENRATDKDELSSLEWLRWDLDTEVKAFFKDEERSFFNILKYLKPFGGVTDGTIR